jgi:hypothetical protein
LLVPLNIIVIFFIWLLLTQGTSFSPREKEAKYFLIFQTLSLLPALQWTRFADAIKEQSPLASWLTSRELTSWNFGSLNDRILFSNWVSVSARFWLFGGIATLVIFPALLVILYRKIPFYLFFTLLLTPVILPLLYFNLYVVHDYYYMALVFPSMMSIALLLNTFAAQNRINGTKFLAIFLSILSLVPSWSLEVPSRDYKAWIRNERNQIPVLSEEISRVTNRQDRILVSGCDWDPSVLFYADRYGIAAPGWIGSTDETLNFVISNKLIDPPQFLAICGNNQLPNLEWQKKLQRVSENVWKIL